MWEYPAVPVDEPGIQRVGLPGDRRCGVRGWVRRQGSSETLLLVRQGRGKSSSLEVRQKLVVMTLRVQIRQPLQLRRWKHRRQRTRPQQRSGRRTSRRRNRRRRTRTRQRRRRLLRPLRTTHYTVYTKSYLRLRWHRHHRGRCERHHAFTHNGSVTKKIIHQIRSTCHTEHNPS